MGFDEAFDRLMQHEGGYVNHPSDPGGETNWGVTKRVAEQWGYTDAMVDLPKETAKEIAKKLYWDACRCSELPFSIAWQLFDASYNHGPKQAIKFLQRVVEVKDDGILGPITIASVNGANNAAICFKFLAERLQFFTDLKTFNTFGKGWSRRVVGNIKLAVDDLGVK